jgi:uncharacterized protein (TIGR03083 family)
MSAPSTLRDDVLARAAARRAPGRSVDAAEPITPLDAFRAATVQLRDVLVDLDEAAWSSPAHLQIGTVRDVVAHLVGVERVVLDWVTATHEPEGSEHLSAARIAAPDVGGVAPADLVQQWFECALAVADACAQADPAKPVLAHDLPTDVDGLLVLRAFELWAHLQDVCRAARVPEPPLDPPRLALMSSRLMRALPIALLLRDVTPSATTVRFVLTGPGGGCQDVTLSPAADGPVATVVADVTDVCRVAARRLPAGELDVVVDGDADAVAPLLGVLDAFARD